MVSTVLGEGTENHKLGKGERGTSVLTEQQHVQPSRKARHIHITIQLFWQTGFYPGKVR
jgi:hypothetical protein